ncbi:MAG: hypothetical protein QOE70_3056 [Chthoniobacter sp.]|jgi:uncharacterized protein (TIGR02599 family)|nr:hypothetical protein [Chthoniobacter sp.]
MLRPSCAPPANRGFTLVELMVSMAILILILFVTFTVTESVSTINRRTRARIDTFQEARAGFETVTRRLSQAMLNTYWDYDFPNNDRSKPPTLQAYVRQSELHFIAGPTKSGKRPLLPDGELQSTTHGLFFQAPFGFSSPPVSSSPVGAAASGPTLQNLLNVGGYFVEYSSDKKDRPKFLLESKGSNVAERWRSRLMEFSQPTENLLVYRTTDATTTLQPYDWFRKPLNTTGDSSTRGMKRVLAENIVALVLWPHRSPHEAAPSGAPRQLAPEYLYDSRLFVERPNDKLAALTRNQMPPMVQVTMVAIDETSAMRLQDRLTNSTTLPEEELGLSVLFQKPSRNINPTKLTEGDQYREDLKAFEEKLIALKLSYRIFSTDVGILQAKWSEN